MDMEQQRLRATIASAQEGSAEAYRSLWQMYGPRLYGYFFRATGRHHDAEDLLGELMLRLLRRLKSYDERGRFEPWLFRIAANMVRDRIRRAKAAPKVISLAAGTGEQAPLAERITAESPEADATVLAEETSAQLQQALDRLEPTTRHMILLRHFGHMSFREIAEVFQCPLGTVLARVHRGLGKLRELMEAGHDTK